jgi:flagellar hook-length control protein FliK
MIASIGTALTAPVSSTPASPAAIAGQASGGAFDFAAMIANIAAPADQPAAATIATADAQPLPPALFGGDSSLFSLSGTDAAVAGDESIAAADADDETMADPAAIAMALMPGLVSIEPLPAKPVVKNGGASAEGFEGDRLDGALFARGAGDSVAFDRSGMLRKGGTRVFEAPEEPTGHEAAPVPALGANGSEADQSVPAPEQTSAGPTASAALAAAAARRSPVSDAMTRAFERTVRETTGGAGERTNIAEPKTANTTRISDAVNEAGARLSGTTPNTQNPAAEPAAPQTTANALQSFAQGSAATNDGSGAGTSRGDRFTDPQAAVEPARPEHRETTTRTVDVHVNPTPGHVKIDAPVVSAGTPAAIPDETMTQIVQQVRLQWRGGIGDARIMLDPEYLGGVNISLRVEGGAVTATVNADSAAVRNWMESNEGLLRQGLAEHGLTLERLVIAGEKADTPRDARDSNERGRDEQPRRERRQQRQQQPTELFEITV